MKLYNHKRNIKLFDIYQEDAKGFLESLNETLLDDWSVWSHELMTWIPVRECMELSNDKTVLVDTPAEGIKENIEVLDFRDSEVSLDLDDSSFSDSRKSYRLKKSVRVKSVEGHPSFKAVTLDLAMGGIRLDKEIPESKKQRSVFPLILEGFGKSTKLLVKVVPKNRDRLKILEYENIVLFRNLLLS